MRLAVVLPSITDFYLSPRRISALGCHTLIRLLEKAGHTIVSPASAEEDGAADNPGRPFLFPLAGKPRNLPLPPEAAYLAEWIVPGERGPLSFFTGLKRFGPDPAACAAVLAREKPDAVLICSFAYAYAEDAVRLAAAVRAAMPETLIVAGGAGVSAWPDYYINPPASAAGEQARPVFDAVFSGEAEPGFAMLCGFLEKRGPGEAGGKTAHLRAPAYAAAESIDCVFSVRRQTREEAWAAVSLCRGCPLGCRFCSARLCHGTEFRAAGLSKIKAAADALAAKLAGKRLHLNFEDDNLLLDLPWFREILSVFRERFPGIAFAAENGLDYRLLSPQSLDLLLDAGFEKFNLSLASIDAGASASQARKTDIGGYLAAASAITGRGLPLVSYFIAGLPEDTPASVTRNLAFLAKAPTLAGISLFYPVPGIQGFDPPPDLLKSKPGLARGSFAYPWTGALSAGRLVTAFRLARLVNLMKKPDPAPPEKEILERCFAEKKLFTLRAAEKRGEAGLRITPVPADREMEKMFFE